MEPVIPATELVRETTASVAAGITELHAAGATGRQVLAELAKAELAAGGGHAFGAAGRPLPRRSLGVKKRAAAITVADGGQR